MANKPQKIADILQAFLKKVESGEEKNLVVDRMWQDAAGRDIIRHTKLMSLKKGVLSVNVDSSAWLYHVAIAKRNLLAELNKRLNNEIKDIKFKIGPIT